MSILTLQAGLLIGFGIVLILGIWEDDIKTSVGWCQQSCEEIYPFNAWYPLKDHIYWNKLVAESFSMFKYVWLFRVHQALKVCNWLKTVMIQIIDMVEIMKFDIFGFAFG